MLREIVVMGAGRGGLPALELVLRSLPEDFGLPVIVAYHRHPGAEPGLRAMLHATSPMPVREVEDKDEVAPGCIYLAPEHYHLLVDEDHLSLSAAAPVHDVRPAVDALFESAAEGYKARVNAVLLGGEGPDGAHGVNVVKRRGGVVIVEDPASAAASAMPKAAIAAASVDRVLAAHAIGPALVERLQVPAASASQLSRGVL
jgi:two-component system chemotaxis response regulator CheB